MGRAFCRTALESSSRAYATIISNRGGLPETTDHCIILKNSIQLVYKQLVLITNEKLRKKLQKDGFENIKHLIKDNTILIDKLRKFITKF